MINFDIQESKNSMAEYLLKLQLIVSNTEFKNKSEADKYETMEYKMLGEAYCRAVTKTDSVDMYRYNDKALFDYLIQQGYSNDVALKYTQDHMLLPNHIRNVIMDEQREKLISDYVEQNPYYHMLSGKPFPGSSKYPADKLVPIPYEFYKAYISEGVLYEGMPVHEMPTKYQDLLMNTEYYQQLLKEYPEQRYLRYIGSNAIPIEMSRMAKDGDIMKINTKHLSTSHPVFGVVTVEPDMIHLFSNVYGETRKYIFDTLRGDFADIYPNYDSFIHFLTIYMSIGSCLNEIMHKSSKMIYMNNSTANDFFMLYGLPSVIMNGPGMISFLKQFRLILQDKGTNVVYRVKDLIGYEYTDIYTLVMVKQQHFENGMPQYDENGNPLQDIVFRRLGTTDDNTSYFKYRDSDKTYTLQEITSGDPRWWDTPEVESMIHDMNYTLSNSKYIQLSTHMSMSDIYWQCIILIRGLLDNRFETQFINLDLGINLNGKSSISVFEAVLILEIMMNWRVKFQGNMYIPNNDGLCCDLLFAGLNDDGTPKSLITGGPFKIASFNFDVKNTDSEFYQSLSDMTYLEPDVFIPMLNSVLERDDNNIGEIMMTEARRIYDYLVDKLLHTQTIYQYRQVTTAFNHLFLVNPVRRKWFDEEFINVQSFICQQFGISETTNDWERFLNVFDPSLSQFTVKDTPVYLYQVLNADVSFIMDNAFMDPAFIEEFQYALSEYCKSDEFNALIPKIPLSIRSYVEDIINTKVMLDTSNTEEGPTTFEALLYRSDPSMYMFINSLRENPNNVLLTMRAIIKALETYVQSNLSGLEYTAFGEEKYFAILKEVITYFKSYMVEFTKDEFTFVFDGFFDQGGNSNMIRLHDDNTKLGVRVGVKDSATLHDASFAKVHEHYADTGIQTMYDEMVVHYRVAYKNVKNIGYPIVYDDGNTIMQTPPYPIDDEQKVVFSIYNNPRSLSADKHQIIIVV